jgi:hypothetical protein
VLVALAACSGGDAMQDRADAMIAAATDALAPPDARLLPNGATGAFYENGHYRTGGTVTLLYDESDPEVAFRLVFRDFRFGGGGGLFDIALYLGEGIRPGVQISQNLVGLVDTIETIVQLPPVEREPDGAQVIVVPRSFGASLADFDSVVLYCRTQPTLVDYAEF